MTLLKPLMKEDVNKLDAFQLPSSINKLVIFDWDDTLFPTTKVMEIINSNNNENPFSEADYKELNKLSRYIYSVLTTYILRYEAHNIFIVTASNRKWIKYSLSSVYNIGKFCDIYDLLFVNSQIQMIHPNKAYLPFATKNQVSEWKYNVFKILLRDSQLTNSLGDSVNTLISFGDSTYEYEAAKRAVDEFKNKNKNVLLHRIKLMQNPSFHDMVNQMKLLLKFWTFSDMSSISHRTDIAIDYTEWKNQH